MGGFVGLPVPTVFDKPSNRRGTASEPVLSAVEGCHKPAAPQALPLCRRPKRRYASREPKPKAPAFVFLVVILSPERAVGESNGRRTCCFSHLFFGCHPDPERAKRVEGEGPAFALAFAFLVVIPSRRRGTCFLPCAPSLRSLIADGWIRSKLGWPIHRAASCAMSGVRTHPTCDDIDQSRDLEGARLQPCRRPQPQLGRARLKTGRKPSRRRRLPLCRRRASRHPEAGSPGLQPRVSSGLTRSGTKKPATPPIQTQGKQRFGRWKRGGQPLRRTEDANRERSR
jgi:hypothetical protein